ncbi:hypothetical protein D3C72_1320320 [compost metagenome]
MHALDGQVLHQNARQQGNHRGLAEGHQPPRPQQQQQAHTGGQVAQAPIGQAPEAVGGIGARRTGQAEQPDGGVAVFIRRAGQQEGQRRPQHAERGEQQKAQQRPRAEQGLFNKHAQDRAQQARVAHRGGALIAGQHAPQGGGHAQHQQGGHPVHRAPTAHVRQRAGHGAGQQDAQQQPAHDRADRLAAFMRRGQGGGKRHQDLGHHRQHSRERGAQQQQDDVVGERGNQQSAGRQQRHQHDQAAAFEQVAQRNQQHQPQRVAQLRGGDDGARHGVGQRELLADGVQQGLRVVIAGNGQAGCHGHQQNDRRGQRGRWCWRGRGGGRRRRCIHKSDADAAGGFLVVFEQELFQQASQLLALGHR